MARYLVPEWFARARNVFPLRFDDRSLVVATLDPGDVQLESELEFASGRSVRFERATAEELEAAWASGYEVHAAIASERRIHAHHALEEEATSLPDGALVGDDSPIARLAHRLLDDGLDMRASDLHIEPTEAGGVVRARVDGVLEQMALIPPELYLRLVSRLKVKGDLDIADRLRPQDGRSTHVRPSGAAVDLRISAIPTRDGEKIVIRFLDPGNVRTLEELGLLPDEASALSRLLEFRDGIVMLTGPTGSGKTSTLYAALRRLDTAHTNVCTVEDPIEYRLPGANQVQVNVARGVTFASALRAFLRQDPDVILLGEIRDAETAEVAVQAALTGHLVLTTLHTNDAVSALTRLYDLGVEQATVADALRGVVAQRLVRKLCDSCAAPGDVGVDDFGETERLLARRFGVQPTRRAVGCEQCRHTGFSGRMAVTAVLPISSGVAEAVRANKPAAAIRVEARKVGVRSMRTVALELVKMGRTTLTEVHRVLGDPDPVAVTAGARDRAEEAVDLDSMLLDVEAIRPAPEAPAPAGPDGAGSVADPVRRTPMEDSRAKSFRVSGIWDTRAGELLLSRKRGPVVLIADQDEADLLRWESHLAVKGWRVTTAVDGEEASRYLRSRDFDLAVLRLRLPMLSERELLRGLRQDGRAAVPVLILTNLQSEDLEEQLLGEGADDFLRKPISPEELERRALAVLRRRFPDQRL